MSHAQELQIDPSILVGIVTAVAINRQLWGCFFVGERLS